MDGTNTRIYKRKKEVPITFRKEEKMPEIIEKVREAKENEFFFDKHTNIGMSEEFNRFVEFINNNSNICIERVNYQSISQIETGRNHISGGTFNFKIISKNEEEEISF